MEGKPKIKPQNITEKSHGFIDKTLRRVQTNLVSYQERQAKESTKNKEPNMCLAFSTYLKFPIHVDYNISITPISDFQ